MVISSFAINPAMEFFNKPEAVRLRSHYEKYLVADDDQETVRQSRNGSGKRAKWRIELIEGKSHSIRLKSCHGRYLTATDIPFLLGVTGRKVLQTQPETVPDLNVEWEPIRDGFQVKIRSWCGKYLRANGGTPPWRNSVTHDDPHHTNTTRSWILWEAEAVDITEPISIADDLSPLNDLSDLDPGSPGSPVSAGSLKNSRSSFVSRISSRLGSKQQSIPAISARNSNNFRSGMELFRNAKSVRLRSHHEKFLHADEDEEGVSQDRNGTSLSARWTVECSSGSESIIRLKSCYGKYLTASNQRFLAGMTGRKVIQSLPRRLDSSVEWEPIKEGNLVKFKTRYGNFLRANGGLPPWRNSLTHDVPHRTATQDWVLWDIDIVEIETKSPAAKPPPPPPPVSNSDSMNYDSPAAKSPPPPPPVTNSDSMNYGSSSLSSLSIKSGTLSRQESSDDSYVISPPKSEGRIIYYHIADANGDVEDDTSEGCTLTFKGNGVEELTRKLEEETGLDGIIVCTRSPLNKKLYPLRLHLPPNNATMHVIVVESSSKVAREFAK